MGDCFFWGVPKNQKPKNQPFDGPGLGGLVFGMSQKQKTNLLRVQVWGDWFFRETKHQKTNPKKPTPPDLGEKDWFLMVFGFWFLERTNPPRPGPSKDWLLGFWFLGTPQKTNPTQTWTLKDCFFFCDFWGRPQLLPHNP